jgi:hypothetical protein
MPIITCFKCQKENNYWDARSLKEPVIINGKALHGSFTYSKYFCPISERKIKNSMVFENQEKVLIIDCMNGNREETREKIVS